MADPYLASNDFPGDGVTTLRTVSFKGNRPDAGSGTVPYLNAADVKASKITPATQDSPETETPLTVTYVGPNQFNVTPACPVGTICRVYRATQDEYNLVDYQNLQTVSEYDLDLANRQTIFIVQEAHDLAQRAKADINQATTIAYDAMELAAIASADAHDAQNTSSIALSTAQAAVVTANAASTTASGAVTTANNALSVANGIDAKATQALADSATAVATANAAAATANGIAGTANTALSQANAAVATANSANVTAGNAQTTANAAVATANGVDAKATQALADSATALSTANAAAATANGFEARVSSLESSRTTQAGQIATLQSDNTTQATQISNLQSGKQNLDATLTGLAALSISANQVPVGSGTDTFFALLTGATGQGLMSAASEAAALSFMPSAYHRANAIGTVSGSGSSNTGAIMERGANAAGSYIRFADGTQICWGLVSLGTVGVSGSAGAIFFQAIAGLAYPAAFADTPVCHIDVVTPGGLAWTSQGSNFSPFGSSNGFVIMNPTAGPFAASALYVAVGRWR